MSDEPVTTELWPEPRITANAVLLSGYIGGALSAHKDRGLYRPVGMEPEKGAMIVERTASGNRFRVKVEQISGRE